jgi:hypothetical protein
MDARLQIPEPNASDVDSVVTALEMAALFGSKGEGNEVVRWLKRAAESAGAEGHDARALSLARTAAELAEQLRSSPDYGRTPSGAPAAGSGAPPSPKSASPRPPAPSSLRSRPPAPSERAQTPPKPLAKRSSAPESPAPEPSAAALNALGDDEPSTITDGPKAPEESGAKASAGPEKPIKFAKGSVCSRQTARVSVQASTEPGVYVMRLLDDDETLPGRAVEGLLVLVDPDAKLPTSDSN